MDLTEDIMFEKEGVKELKADDYIVDYDWLKKADEDVLFDLCVFPLPELKGLESDEITLGGIFDKLRDGIELRPFEKFNLSYYLKFLKDGPQNSVLDGGDEEKGFPFYEEVVWSYLADLYDCWIEWIKLNKNTKLAKIMTYKGMLIRFHNRYDDEGHIYPLSFASFSSDIYGLYDFTEGIYYEESPNQKCKMIITTTNNDNEEESGFGVALDNFIVYLGEIGFWDEDTVVPDKTNENEVLYELSLDNIIVGDTIGEPYE